MFNLPGSIHPVQPGDECVDCGKPATVRVQGETDSFGAEYHAYCASCRALWEATLNIPHISFCDHCKQEEETKPWRDLDEGSSGPVYYICSPCRREADEAYRSQLMTDGEYMARHEYDDYDS